MSMLKRFFERTDEDNSYLLKNLDILQKYKAYMGQYPVIIISLKAMKQQNYFAAFEYFKIFL